MTEDFEKKTTEPLPFAEEAQEDEPAPRKMKLPKVAWVFYGLALISGIIEIICIISEPFANFFTVHVACYTRAALAWLTAWIPFSAGELTVMLIPLILVTVIWLSVKYYADSWRNVGIYVLLMLSIVSLFFTCYVFTLGTGYQGSRLDKKMEIDRRDVSAEELKYTTQIMIEGMEENLPYIYYGGDDFSIMPFNYKEMVNHLLEAFDKVSEKYDFITNFDGPVKTVMHSEPWTYTHITGVYSYFTGEANINTNMPDYTIPFTAAHELAHQRGIAREDEANFVAFLVCTASDEPYIRYCGYVNMYEYLAGPLYSANSEMYSDCYFKVPKEIRAECSAYSKFFNKYRQNVVATVSNAVNDTYLKINGTEGSKSYGLVVDLAVAYFRPKN